VCRFVSVRAERMFEVLRIVPVRVNIRLRVTRSVSHVPDLWSDCQVCRDVRASLCCCVSLHVIRVVCRACRDL
jgi:hypothetical protein